MFGERDKGLTATDRTGNGGEKRRSYENRKADLW
jgi:hypothetical protein